MNKITTISILALTISFSACNNSAQPQESQNNNLNKNQKMEISNKEKALALLKSIETGDTVPVGYINPNKYIQHNLGIADGLAGFGAALAQLPPNSAKVNTVRAFEDGDFVFTHTDYNFFGPKIGFDIFRFEEGKIVEHWDNMQEKPSKPNPSGHTMTDGATEIKDIDKTASNKLLIQRYADDILVKRQMDSAAGFYNGDNYIQHNPLVADKLSGISKALEEWAKKGITMTYTTVHKVLGQGNFVLAVSEGELGGKHTAFYDLFRIENGKIAEHWDVIEEIPAKDTWKNNNGKF